MPRRKIEINQGEKISEVKSKKKNSGSTYNAEEPIDAILNPKSELKLKLKLGKETLGEKKLAKVRIVTDSQDEDPGNAALDASDEDSLVDVTTSQVDDDEEEAWLDALEKGDLDDYGELKKIKDPSLMTARQRALKDRTSVLSSMSFANVTLLGESKQAHTISDEAKKRKEEKNKRRKLQAVKKVEESQKQTIERLIKQQGSKIIKERQKKSNINGNGTTLQQQKPDAKLVAMVKYLTKAKSVTLSYPEGAPCPIQPKTLHSRPVQPPCGVCGGTKKYSCSTTGVALCSMQCYKVNLARITSAVEV